MSNNNESNRIVLSPVKRNPNNINNKYSEFAENIAKQLGEIVEIGVNRETYNIYVYIPSVYVLDDSETIRTDFFGSGTSFEDACEDYTYKLYESKNLRYNKATLILPESPMMSEFCIKFIQNNFQLPCKGCTKDECNSCIEKMVKRRS